MADEGNSSNQFHHGNKYFQELLFFTDLKMPKSNKKQLLSAKISQLKEDINSLPDDLFIKEDDYAFLNNVTSSRTRNSPVKKDFSDNLDSNFGNIEMDPRSNKQDKDLISRNSDLKTNRNFNPQFNPRERESDMYKTSMYRESYVPSFRPEENLLSKSQDCYIVDEEYFSRYVSQSEDKLSIGSDDQLSSISEAHDSHSKYESRFENLDPPHPLARSPLPHRKRVSVSPCRRRGPGSLPRTRGSDSISRRRREPDSYPRRSPNRRRSRSRSPRKDYRHKLSSRSPQRQYNNSNTSLYNKRKERSPSPTLLSQFLNRKTRMWESKRSYGNNHTEYNQSPDPMWQPTQLGGKNSDVYAEDWKLADKPWHSKQAFEEIPTYKDASMKQVPIKGIVGQTRDTGDRASGSWIIPQTCGSQERREVREKKMAEGTWIPVSEWRKEHRLKKKHKKPKPFGSSVSVDRTAKRNHSESTSSAEKVKPTVMKPMQGDAGPMPQALTTGGDGEGDIELLEDALIDQKECDRQVESISIAKLIEDKLSPMEEEVLMESDNVSKPAETGKKPKKRLFRGEMRRKRIEEALARGEKILSRKERRLAWAAEHPNLVPSEAGFSRNQEAGKKHCEGGTHNADSSKAYRKKSGKREPEHLTPEDARGEKNKTRKKEGEGSDVSQRVPAPTYLEKMAIARSEHPDIKLMEAEADKIKGELSRRAIYGKDVRISSCHLEGGALVVGCANATTKDWLVKQVQELSLFGGIPLQLVPARSLVKVVKVSTFVPRLTGAMTKKDVIVGLKLQNDLDTDHWVIVGGNSSPGGQFLVMIIDEPSLQKLKSLAMRPFLGCERVTFRLH